MKNKLLLLVGVVLLFTACSKESELTGNKDVALSTVEKKAKKGRPLKGAMTYNITTEFDLPCDCGDQASAGNFYGTGKLSHLGKTTSQLEPCVSPILSGQQLIGLYVGTVCGSFKAANGDELYSTIRPYNLLFTSTGATAYITADIIGGTGRFAGATGSFNAKVVNNLAGTMSTLTNINGTIFY